MKPEQAAVVLAMAATLDARLTPPSPEDAKARAVGWAHVLDQDMTVDEARACVIEHYREATASLMPAHVNRLHRDRRRMARSKQIEISEPCEHEEPRGAGFCALCRGRS